jgi:glycosyltransferase involved in cell wall biosynthesis
MMLRLGFHYHVPMLRTASGEIKTVGALGLFLDSLAARCASLTCFMHSPRPQELAQIDYTLQARNLTWVDIGPHTSTPHRMVFSRRFTQPVHDYRPVLDALLIRGPSPLLPAVAHAARPLPTALLLVGDYRAGIDTLPQPRWRKEAIRAWAAWNERQQLEVARQSLTFVNSRKLYEQLVPNVPLLHETRTTTLSNADFFQRDDTCIKSPYQVLYTGRLDRAKGLLDMVEAVALLVKQGKDVVLNLVGAPQKGDAVLDEIDRVARAHGIRDRVLYHGFKSVGAELFAYYRMADIYLIASQSDFEGFPRTIWEALAHSLPVVATTVGSIPYFLGHEEHALLVPPKSPAEIAAALSRLISDAALRRRLISGGYKLAQSNTLEVRSKELTDSLMRFVAERSARIETR